MRSSPRFPPATRAPAEPASVPAAFGPTLARARTLGAALTAARVEYAIAGAAARALHGLGRGAGDLTAVVSLDAHLLETETVAGWLPARDGIYYARTGARGGLRLYARDAPVALAPRGPHYPAPLSAVCVDIGGVRVLSAAALIAAKLAPPGVSLGEGDYEDIRRLASRTCRREVGRTLALYAPPQAEAIHANARRVAARVPRFRSVWPL